MKISELSSRRATLRIEHEAEAGASGALVGAIVGSSAGPPGAIAGAILGGVAGALAGAVMDQEASAKAQHTRELDEDLGASGRSPSGPVLDDGVSFSIERLGSARVTGRFTTWRGSLLFDEQAPQNSRLEVMIDAASIDTQEPRRDAHLRSADFFDAEKYPTLVFKSTKVDRAGDKFKVTGDLTMHGFTKPVTLDVEYADRGRPPMGGRAAFVAHGSLNRKDWGLTWNHLLAGGLALGDEIEIHLGIEATRAS